MRWLAMYPSFRAHFWAPASWKNFATGAGHENDRMKSGLAARMASTCCDSSAESHSWATVATTLMLYLASCLVATSFAAMSSLTLRYMIPTVLGLRTLATQSAVAEASRIPLAWQGNIHGSSYSLLNQPHDIHGSLSFPSRSWMVSVIQVIEGTRAKTLSLSFS